MILIPLLIVVVGLGLSWGLFCVAQRTRSTLLDIENALRFKTGSSAAGLVKLQGRVKSADQGESLISPIEKRPCVFYKLVIEQLPTNAAKPSFARALLPANWKPIVKDVQAICARIADDRGELAVDLNRAQLEFTTNGIEAKLLTDMPQELEETLRERYQIAVGTFIASNHLRYTEIVIAEGDEVFVVGDCQVRDGKATLTANKHPLLVTLRKEQEVVRNGRNRAAIFALAAGAVTLATLAVAMFLFTSIAGQAASSPQNAAKDIAKEAITKLKNKSASLSDRASAAKKLAETPVTKNLIGEAAPLLNPLLESKDRSHRESALQAIQHGWGSSANESTLRRALQTTTDIRIQKDISAAIRRLGSS